MAIPTFVAAGAQGNSATGGGTSCTPGMPAGIAANDILILAVEAANEPVNALTGWTQVGSSAVVNANGLVTDLTFRWLRYTGSETAPTVTITGANHVIARIAAFRGCLTSGSPINGTPQTSATADATTAVSIPGGTTTAADCLIVAGFSTGQDVSSTTNVGSWTNASLASPAITEFFDNWNVTGNGGGFGAAYGGKATAGAYSATTATLVTGNTKACMSFALQGASAPTSSPPPSLVMAPRR